MGIGWIDWTPRVFWAVTAVRAVVPNTPKAWKVLRSAWIPAPPPLSDPAMVRAMGRTARVHGFPVLIRHRRVGFPALGRRLKYRIPLVMSHH